MRAGATATANATVTIGAPAPTAAIQATLEREPGPRHMADHQRGVGDHQRRPRAGQRLHDVPGERDDDVHARGPECERGDGNRQCDGHDRNSRADRCDPGDTGNATRARVTWQTTNAVSATINGAPVPVNGSTTFPVTATTTFTLVARNASGSTATANATVTIGAPAPTAAIQASLETSTRARVTWQTTNAVDGRASTAPPCRSPATRFTQ